MKISSIGRVRATLMAGLLATTALGGFAAGHSVLADTTPPAGAIQPTRPAAVLPDFSQLAAQVRPAVVSVTAKIRARPEGMEQMAQGHQGHMGGGEARGSGFIIDADGTVVTNNHVVRDAEQVSITLDDGTELPARVVGRDARTDLAVLKVDAKHTLPFITLGDSDSVQPGQWVVAVGNPFGLGGTVTAGIVSARGRDIGAGPYDEFLQIDAPINQGNSGGPLFTQDGKVVGVNTAILSPTGGSVGIGFAIPSDLVKTVVAQLRSTGHVVRGYLGVESQPVTAAIAPALHLQGNARGALVANVTGNSPASKAGLQPGDVVTAVDGHAVTTPRDLARDIAAEAPGTATKLDVLRDGTTRSLTATVSAQPDDQVAANPSGQPSIGLGLAPLTPELRARLEVPSHASGAVVAQVQPGSAAEQAGLQPGDVIVGVGSRAVSSPEEAVTAIRTANRGGAGLALRVMREGRTGFVPVGPATGDQPQGGSNQDEPQQG